MATPPDSRPEPPWQGDERPMLAAWLEYQRATLLWKCDQLDGDALVCQKVPPSTLSLLGLVRHMTLVEWSWFVHIFAGDPQPAPIATDADRDADFNDLDPARAMGDIETFEHQCDVSRSIAERADGLDVIAASAKRPVSLRWIMIHMIEEYARHNGHADLLRERIDGAVGE
jgi:uncharacterized damage-inducible protein DinB